MPGEHACRMGSSKKWERQEVGGGEGEERGGEQRGEAEFSDSDLVESLPRLALPSSEPIEESAESMMWEQFSHQPINARFCTPPH